MPIRDGGCYGHVDGPRFNTRAEIRGLAACGVTAVSQTAGPETVLSGEAELPYALLGFLTDYANGVHEEPTPVETLIEMMAASTETFAARAARGAAARGRRRAGAARDRVPLRVEPSGSGSSSRPGRRCGTRRRGTPRTRSRPTRSVTPS